MGQGVSGTSSIAALQLCGGRLVTPASRWWLTACTAWLQSQLQRCLHAVRLCRVATACVSVAQVDINATENRFTGVALITPELTVVVVEGCNKSHTRYEKLMLRRIDWSLRPEDAPPLEEPNHCYQVWKVRDALTVAELRLCHRQMWMLFTLAVRVR